MNRSASISSDCPISAVTLACALFAILLACCTATAAPIGKKKPPKRPRILGIAGVTILVSDVPAAHRYYRDLIDPGHACDYCVSVSSPYLFLPSGQRITFKTMPAPSPSDLLADISFLTDDLDGFRRYLDFRKIQPDEVRKKHGGELISLLFQDPEGHHLSITDAYHIANSEDLKAGLPPANPSNPVRIIHAGIVVNDRALIDRFYVDVLGFRPYWHGARNDDGKDDWVSRQVPDGTDWVEYMLNIRANPDKHTLGVMNHIALGVPDIHARQQELIAHSVQPKEEPKIGRDGKWQLNLYDSDLTRIEFMEFKPVQKPCCSDFTASHPGPKQ